MDSESELKTGIVHGLSLCMCIVSLVIHRCDLILVLLLTLNMIGVVHGLRRPAAFVPSLNRRNALTKLFDQRLSYGINLSTFSTHKTVKRNVALVVGYVGKGYYGLQLQDDSPLFANDSTPSLPTIEGELRLALLKSGLALESNLQYGLSRLGWERSSRTDKGVHAARIVFSGKLELTPEMDLQSRLPEVVQQLNSHLPTDKIRVFSCVRVGPSFNARDDGLWRHYTYMLPMRLLRTDLDDDLNPSKSSKLSKQEADQLLEKFNTHLQEFEGKHSFHNFHRLSARNFRKNKPVAEKSVDSCSSDQDTIDDFCDNQKVGVAEAVVSEREALECVEDVAEDTRHMVYGPQWTETPRLLHKKLESVMYLCRAEFLAATPNSDPATPVDDYSERMVRVHLIGKSFLLHQIRLMVSAALLVTRNVLPTYFVPLALNLPIHFPLPLAPAEGLLLTSAEFRFRMSQQVVEDWMKEIQGKTVDPDETQKKLLGRVLHMYRDTPDSFQDTSVHNVNESLNESIALFKDASLMTRAEFNESETFFFEHIAPQMTSDWRHKTVSRREGTRTLLEDYFQDMKNYDMAPETQRLWDTRLRSELWPQQVTHWDTLRRQRGVSDAQNMVSLLRDTLGHVFWRIKHIVERSIPEEQRPRHRATYNYTSLLQDTRHRAEALSLLQSFLKSKKQTWTPVRRLNMALRGHLTQKELKLLRNVFHHRVLLPKATATQLTTQLQVYNGLSLRMILRILATRMAIEQLFRNVENLENAPETIQLPAQWDAQSLVSQLQEEIDGYYEANKSLLPAEMTVTGKKSCPEYPHLESQVMSEARFKRNKALLWLAQFTYTMNELDVPLTQIEDDFILCFID